MAELNGPASYIPYGYSETSDAFAHVLIYGHPPFQEFHGSPHKCFTPLLIGLGSVIHKTKNAKAIKLLEQCKEEIIAVREAFILNPNINPEERRPYLHRLQKAYYNLYKEAGHTLRPNTKDPLEEIDPDDDV